MTIASPDVFRAQPGRGTGVRRLNRRPLLIAFGLMIVVAGAIGYTALDRANRTRVQTQAPSRAPAASADPAPVLADAPEAGLIAPALPPVELADPMKARSPSDGYAQTPTDGATPASQDDATARAWEQYRQRQARIDEAKAQAALAALSAPSSVAIDAASDQAIGMNPLNSGMPGLPQLPAMPDVAQLAAAMGSGRGAAPEVDPNRAAAKAAWLSNASADRVNYLASTRAAPISPYELKAGAVIPGVMIGGINSDLPGQILGQVRQDVWDTATGRFLLIPRGARLVGTYDSQVTRGQSRVLIAWTRVIFPDGSSLDLGQMPGTDQAGYAGLKDQVNNHTFAVFRDAAMLSLLAAGAQLSQPQGQAAGGYDTQQILAASLGQQLTQTGSQIVSRNVSIQPTLEIRPGMRFNVAVTKDIVLLPWKG